MPLASVLPTMPVSIPLPILPSTPSSSSPSVSSPLSPPSSDLSSNTLTGPLPNGMASPAFRSSAPAGSFFYAMQNNFFTGSSATMASNGDYFCPLGPYSSINANCLADSDSSYVDACDASSQRSMLVDCVSFCNVFSDRGPCGGNGQCFISPATMNPTCLCNAGYTAQASSAYSSVCVPTAQYVAPPTPNFSE